MIIFQVLDSYCPKDYTYLHSAVFFLKKTCYNSLYGFPSPWMPHVPISKQERVL